MSIEELRKRLERLNRGALAGRIRSASEMSDNIQASETALENDIERLVPGFVRHSEGAEYYSIEHAIEDDVTLDTAIGARLVNAIDGCSPAVNNEPVQESLREAVAAGASRLLFLDLETCGFSGTPVFLIGLMYYQEDRLFVEQLLARSYAEESAIIRRLAELLDDRSHLVTFNGKSFDWPFLTGRSAVARVKLPQPSGHCDLLHPSRRRFRANLPDCKLQTLEQHICRRRRYGDIPGSEIPAAYHRFVRTRDARQIRDVLRHNFLDLVTMAEILAELLRGESFTSVRESR